MTATLEQARETLRDVTPLRMDCGQVCGGACCRSLPGERTGMLLFPGEAALYRDKPGYEIIEAEGGELLVCAGACERTERPLSCRLFPLLPLLREEGVKVAMDARAKAACPLAAQGVRGLAEEFVGAVRRAGQILAEDEVQRAFLRRLTEEHDELRALHKRFG